MATESARGVPIASLQPSLENPNERQVHGVVTLIWPYSSTTRSLRLLLVEPDFRLRAKRGEVRILFRGASARALSKAAVTNGDRLSLDLRGVEWVENKITNSTPGREVNWSLEYHDFLNVQVCQQASCFVYLLRIVDYPCHRRNRCVNY